MKRTNEYAERLLASNELALAAICGQTGKLFVMVVERRSRTLLEIVRAVPIEDPRSGSKLVRSEKQLQPRHAQTHSRTSFQQLAMTATVEIGDAYRGCPYCRARGYFRCSRCELFSCWTKYNSKVHADHEDVWCAGCRSWRCTSNEGDDSSMNLTAYAMHARTVRRTANPSKHSIQHQIGCMALVPRHGS